MKKEEKCVDELSKWFLKWVNKGSSVSPEFVLGCMESIKIAYLLTGIKKIKQI